MGELIIHVSVNYAKLAGFTGFKAERLDSQLETFRSRFFPAADSLCVARPEVQRSALSQRGSLLTRVPRDSSRSTDEHDKCSLIMQFLLHFIGF